MAVNILKSIPLTNRDATPQTFSDLRYAGRPFQKQAFVLTVTADSIASQYGFFSLPSNATLVSVSLSCAALSTAVAADIGLWETPANGGFSTTTGWATQAGSVANAKQFFGAAVSLVAAQTKTQLLYNNSTFVALTTALNPADKKIWQLLGLTSDPMRDYDLVATLTVAVVAGGGILLEVAYKLQ